MKFTCEHRFPVDRLLPGSRLQAMKELLEQARQQAEERRAPEPAEARKLASEGAQ